MDRQDSTTITIRSFIYPDEPVVGFRPGEPFSMTFPDATTLGALIRKLFYKQLDQIGVMAVNGKLASGKTILSQRDLIAVYPLLEGG